jgi:uncharacterized integral membrane protein
VRQNAALCVSVSTDVVSFSAGTGKDGVMTSDPSALPDRPSDAVPEPAPAEPPSAATPALPESAVKFTRAAALWSALITGFVILILLLVFIMQNTDSATVHFFAWEWNLPIGVGVLLAAVSGGLLTVAAGTARIVQLRRAAKRNLKAGL